MSNFKIDHAWVKRRAKELRKHEKDWRKAGEIWAADQANQAASALEHLLVLDDARKRTHR